MRFIYSSFLLILLLFIGAPKATAQHIQLDSTLLTASDLATGLQVPWEVKWGGDDHLWVSERRGRILRIDPENGNTETVLNHENEVLSTGGEYGMLGLALHPQFPGTPLVYVVYCYSGGGNIIRERLSSFRWNGTALSDEEILLNDIPGAGIHDGSRLLMTTDDKILMTTGDRGSSNLAQDMNSLNGKILRMNLDGTIPADNPTPGSYIYSYGHRNPQGLTYGPNGQIYSSEHGASTSDEFNLIEENRNYGWPNVEGACNTGSEQAFCLSNNVREPLAEWSPCVAVNDILYYEHPAIPEWDGKMLMAVLGGFVQDPRLSVLTFNEEGTAVTGESRVLENLGRIRDVAMNPYTGAIYVATNGNFYPGSGPNRIIEYRNLAFEVTSVSTPNTADQFVRIFPNPVTDQLELNCSASFVGQVCEVISFSGQVVQQFKIRSTAEKIEAGDWPSGMYFLRTSNEQGTITRTFTKQ
jgi:glucose/arabinose dehydrogenase